MDFAIVSLSEITGRLIHDDAEWFKSGKKAGICFDDGCNHDFMLIGAQKCGTSWLHHHLRLSESIFMRQDKDRDHFNVEFRRIPGESQHPPCSPERIQWRDLLTRGESVRTRRIERDLRRE